MANPTEEQFLGWYDRYADRIFRHCLYRVYDREKAKDLTQQTFMKAWEYLQQGNCIAEAQAFLYRTANNLIIDESRKRQNLSLDELVDTATFDVMSTEDTAHDIDIKLAISVLGKLDRSTRDVLIMRFIDGFTPKEIAEMLGESANVISVRLSRAKAKVREIMKTSTVI